MSAPGGFSALLDAFAEILEGITPREQRRKTADEMPLSAERADIRGRMSPEWALNAWEASVADAARELRELITIHEGGGTASSPAKIKSAARELLRLLGED